MFRKIVDVLKEVFWIKPSRKRSKLPLEKKAKKAVVKKTVKPKPKAPAKVIAKASVTAKTSPKPTLKEIDPSLVQVGTITHYFERIKVCVVKLTQGTVLIGDKLTIVGPKTKFIQKLWSMQIESEDVKVAKKGQLIGLKVDKIAAVGDKVYK
jgi:translation initiation factor IF-2